MSTSPTSTRSQIPLPIPSSPGIPITRTKSNSSNSRSSTHPYAKPSSNSNNASGTINSAGTIGRAKGKRSSGNVNGLASGNPNGGTKGISTSSSSSIPIIDYASIVASSSSSSSTSNSNSIPLNSTTTNFPEINTTLANDSSSSIKTNKSKKGKRSPRLSLGESTAKSTAAVPTTTTTTHSDHLSALAPSFTPGVPLSTKRLSEEEFPRLESTIVVTPVVKEVEVTKIEEVEAAKVEEVEVAKEEEVVPQIESVEEVKVIEPEKVVEEIASVEEVIAGPSSIDLKDVKEVLPIETEEEKVQAVVEETPVETETPEEVKEEVIEPRVVIEEVSEPEVVVEALAEEKEDLVAEVEPEVVETLPVVVVESPIVVEEQSAIVKESVLKSIVPAAAKVLVPEAVEEKIIEPVVEIEEEIIPVSEEVFVVEESTPYLVDESEVPTTLPSSDDTTPTLPLPSTTASESVSTPTSTSFETQEEESTFPSDLILSPINSDESPSPPEDKVPAADPPSLTMAIVTAWNTTTWSQRIPAIFASIAINFGLPFINGVMLGKFFPPVSKSQYDLRLVAAVLFIILTRSSFSFFSPFSLSIPFHMITQVSENYLLEMLLELN